MSLRDKVVVAWSSGKDSALAFSEVVHSPGLEAVALLTTILAGLDRIGMHHVRHELVQQQAASLGLPLIAVPFVPTVASGPGTPEPDNEMAMRQALAYAVRLGATTVVFGDIMLVDLRDYREVQMAGLGMKARFPLWKRDTRDLVSSFITRGFKAVITSVDTSVLDRGFLGRRLDAHFLADLPCGVDPCGENGEYHSFVFDGPAFRSPVAYTVGGVTSREDRYFYLDLIPVQADQEKKAATVSIEIAETQDAQAILDLQKLAFRSQAALYDDDTIPPLTQTLDSMEEDLGRAHVLKAVVDGRIVGSVRGHLCGGTCFVERLIVHPDFQNRGIGTKLVQDLEERFHDAERYELGTGERSERNIHLYTKLGYRVFGAERLTDRVTLVRMEKNRG